MLPLAVRALGQPETHRSFVIVRPPGLAGEYSLSAAAAKGHCRGANFDSVDFCGPFSLELDLLR